MDRLFAWRSGYDFKNKAGATDTAIRILDVDPDQVIAHREFDIGDINAGGLHKWFDARRQIDIWGLQISNFDRVRINLRASKRLKCQLEMHRRMHRFALVNNLDLGTSGNTTPIRHNSTLGRRQFGLFLRNQDLGCIGRDYRRPADRSDYSRKSYKPTPNHLLPFLKQEASTKYYRVPPSPITEYGAQNNGSA